MDAQLRPSLAPPTQSWYRAATNLTDQRNSCVITESIHVLPFLKE